ncbi:MAG: hypothetical protein KAJ51_02810 [Thermoplasmata archaeon]|nr:hypothetical protein [Thermoplasmata archaeon]
MKHLNWKITLGVSLIILSMVVYFIHWLIFRDPHHIFIYMIGDIAFVFIEVLMVTLIIHALLSEREKRTVLEKLNMVIGLFFSEVGTNLLVHFSDYDPNLSKIRKELIVTNDWSDQEFERVSRHLKNYEFEIDLKKIEFEQLQELLVANTDFLVRLLENPILLEHETFTELLRAVFHLTEELAHREDITKSPLSDRQHIAGDIKRAYVLLVSEWLDYMKHLKNNYPYLFSLAMRTNPFDKNATPIIKA